MRSRTLREGSVGLLLLLGLGLFGGLVLWLNRFTVSQSSYKIIVEFNNAGGMKKGDMVRYRGFEVGNISAIRPSPNNIEVELDITRPDLKIPNDVIVEANQSGLISQNIIDITPRKDLSPGAVSANPTDKNCDSSLIVCNGGRLKGGIGISIDQLIRSSTEFAAVYSSPNFYKNINKTLESATLAASSVAELSRSLNSLSKATQNEIGTFSSAAKSVEKATTTLTASAVQTSDKVGNTVTQFGATASEFSQVARQINTTLNQLSSTTKEFGGTAKSITSTANAFTNTANSFGATANSFGATANTLNATANTFNTTAKDISLTANQANRLITNLDSLVTSNRSSLVATLNNVSKASEQLSTTIASLSPVVNRLTQGELLKNFEILSANAAQASANLRDVTKAMNDPSTVLVLQKTLDSARVTFENTQKITSDLDELTGDPSFRENLRRLVNGLKGLVSSTEEIQKRVEVANTLDTVKTTVSNANIITEDNIIPNQIIDSKQLDSKQSSAKNKNLDLYLVPVLPQTPEITNSSQQRLIQNLREYKQERGKAEAKNIK
jgi:phospholipid/cholesterol/gamma-HCH transport system substrate-binding protein